MRKYVLGLMVGAVVCSSCARVSGTEAGPQAGGQKGQKTTAKTSQEQPTPPTTKLVTMRDPVEDAYTMGMPEGWSNRIYSARSFDIHSMVDISVSPNGSVLIFAGDPNIPQYWSPHAANDITRFCARVNPKMKIEAFRPADVYFKEYVNRKFGKLQEFKIISAAADEEGRKKLQARFDEVGINLRATSARITFSYSDAGKTMNALIYGSCADAGGFWIPSVSGITTYGDPTKYEPMIEAIGKTRKMNPQWQARQAQKHQEAMAQIQRFGEMMTAQHNQNMAWIQQSAQRHQARMQAIQAQGDASTRAFNERMASGDAQHRSFLNYINDEHTVVGAGGKAFQVDNGYQRYFMHKENRTYIGGDSTMDLDKLRRLNLNPDDYEEVKVKR